MKIEEKDGAWVGDWEARISNRLQSRGFNSLNQFFAVHAGRSYFELADLLSENGDIAAVQLENLHASSSVGLSDTERLETMCDSLVRFLSGALKKGWGLDRYWESAVTGALASWTVMWEQVPWARNVVRQLFASPPPKGWIPANATDVWIRAAIAAANR